MSSPGFRLERLDHVGPLAVQSVAAACELFVGVLQAESIGGGDNLELGVRAVQVRLPPGTKIELLEPLDEDSFLAGYLEANGEGIHHMTAYVDDVEAAATALTDAGYEVVDTSIDRPSWHETFLRPSSGFGALIQLARPQDAWDAPIDGMTLADVLAGEIQVFANVVSRKDTGEQLHPQASG